MTDPVLYGRSIVLGMQYCMVLAKGVGWHIDIGPDVSSSLQCERAMNYMLRATLFSKLYFWLTLGLAGYKWLSSFAWPWRWTFLLQTSTAIIWTSSYRPKNTLHTLSFSQILDHYTLDILTSKKVSSPISSISKIILPYPSLNPRLLGTFLESITKNSFARRIPPSTYHRLYYSQVKHLEVLYIHAIIYTVLSGLKCS